MKINRNLFFNKYKDVFGPIKKDASVESIEAILNEFQAADIKIRPLEKLAYALATVRHEVGPAMLPIVENMNYSAKRMMEVWPSRFTSISSARPYANNPEKLGNNVYGGRLGNGIFDGYKFRGRGIGAQITGADSYRKYGELLGMDFIKDPDLVMDVNIGARILMLGFTDHPFTGYKISNSINGNKVDYIQARRTVNADVGRVGESIAKDARKFEEILRYSVDK